MTTAEWIFLTVLFVLPHANAITANVLLAKERKR